MNALVKSKWIAALRSGEFKQSYGFEKQVDGEDVTYCALGVLCEIASPNAQWKPMPGSPGAFRAANFWAIKDVSELSAFAVTDITIWNDSDKLTFPEIADRLEMM